MRKDIIIRPETHKDYKDIISLILRSFREGTDYSDGIDVVALVEEIRDSKYYIPELSFVAELNGKIVGHFLFSRFPLSRTKTGGHIEDDSIAMLAPVAVHADYVHEHIGLTMLTMGIQRVREYGFKGILWTGCAENMVLDTGFAEEHFLGLSVIKALFHGMMILIFFCHGMIT